MTGSRFVLRFTVACAAVLLTLAPVFAASPAGAQATAEWNVAMVGGPAAGSGVTIAVVDTGVDVDHPAFGGRVLPGQDFVDNDDDASNGGDGRNEDGHGTHVAGIAAGEGIGCGERTPAIIGVAPQASVLPVRVLDETGSGTLEDVAEGIDWAVEHGATVINLSLGDQLGVITGRPETLTAAMNRAWAAGVIPVIAAGNDGLLGQLFGSGYGDVNAVVVTAVDQDNRLASYATSTGDSKWGIAAPGGDSDLDIWSATPGATLENPHSCSHMMGTSMATPHVAGALALLRSRGLPPQQAVDRVLDTAATSARGTGHGLLDMAAALQGLGGGGTTSTTTTTAATPTTATTTTVGAGGGSTTSTTGATSSTTTPTSTSSTPKDTTTTTMVLKGPPPLPDDDDTADDELADDMSLDVDDDDIPGAVALGATLTAGLVWIGWVVAFRRGLG